MSFVPMYGPDVSHPLVFLCGRPAKLLGDSLTRLCVVFVMESQLYAQDDLQHPQHSHTDTLLPADPDILSTSDSHLLPTLQPGYMSSPFQHLIDTCMGFRRFNLKRKLDVFIYTFATFSIFQIMVIWRWNLIKKENSNQVSNFGLQYFNMIRAHF